MALYHKATVSPSKPELLASWVPEQTWSPDGGEVTPIGAFRFDDPEGQVGMETFLVEMDGVILQVPLTYRPEPLAGAEEGLITEMHHTALGTRWVYDGLSDPLYRTMLAAVSMTGQGEALGMVIYEGRWHLAPAQIRITGGGWTDERACVDGFTLQPQSESDGVFHSERFELRVHRRPVPADRPPLALASTWDGQADPVVLAEVRELEDPGS